MKTYTIKPLEWRDNKFGGLIAEPFGPFSYHIRGNEYTITRANVCGAPPWIKTESEGAAKAACQADYEMQLGAVLAEA